MPAMYEPAREIVVEGAIVFNPLRWPLLPRINRKPPSGFRGGWQFMWLFVDHRRWWRYV